MAETYTFATRRSALAMAQARLAKQLLEASLGGNVELLELVTTGDRRTDWSLENKGGKGLFTKELEEALLDGRAILAVHSAKDLPTELPDGLVIAGYLPRETPNDVLVRRRESGALKRIATSSPRRREQARLLWADAEFCEIRGNVETRLRKIKEGQADATLLAAAGLNRLGIHEWEGLEFEKLPFESMIPAAGQAAIAIECRAEDHARLAPLLDEGTAIAVTLERTFLEAFGGGCNTAIGAHFHNGELLTFHNQTGRAQYSIPQGRKEEMVQVVREIAREARSKLLD